MVTWPHPGSRETGKSVPPGAQVDGKTRNIGEPLTISASKGDRDVSGCLDLYHLKPKGQLWADSRVDRFTSSTMESSVSRPPMSAAPRAGLSVAAAGPGSLPSMTSFKGRRVCYQPCADLQEKREFPQGPQLHPPWTSSLTLGQPRVMCPCFDQSLMFQAGLCHL